MTAGAGSAPGGPVPPPAPFFRLPYLYVLAGAETVYLFVAALSPRSPLLIPLGLVTLFLAPGYAIGALTLGPRTHTPRSLTFALVVGWSVAVNVGIGILLLVARQGLSPLVIGGSAFALVGVAAAYWSYRALATPASSALREVGQRLRLTGYRPAQRVTAYFLLTLIGAVFVVILYLASVVPNPTPNLLFSITGYGGTTANLPPRGAVNTTLTIWAIVQNGATPQSFTLVVLSSVQGTAPTSYRSIPWAVPLVLGSAVSAADPFSLAAAQNVTVNVEFQFPQSGSYLLQFLLETAGGSVVRSTNWSVVIS